MYRYVDAALLRATAHPSELALPPRPEAGTGENTEQWRHWIEQTWALKPVAEAVELASPALAHRIGEICDGGSGRPKAIKRAAASLDRYLLRLQYRPTPFGLFAGIAPIRIGPGFALRWGDEHHPTARVDAVWLNEMIARLETCPALLARLSVTTDPTCFVRDGRLVVPCQQAPHQGRRGPGEVSVRLSRPVQSALTWSSSPVSASELAEKVAADVADAPAGAIEELVVALVACRVLITGLRAAMTTTDPLGHVLAQLAAADADAIAAIAPTLRALHQAEAALARHAEAAPKERRGLRVAASAQMRGHCDLVEQPMALDLRLDCSLRLPPAVAHEAERAADTLARLTPYPHGSRAWQDYHARFLDRYGTAAVVPIRSLIDPDTGLGLPAGYRGSHLPRPTAAHTARDDELLALAQRAACEGTREVALGQADLTALAHTRKSVPLPHIDLRFHLLATTRHALEYGDFTLAVTGLTPAAGGTAGRFLDTLQAADRARMTTAYTNLPTLDGDAIRAQLSSPPLHARTEALSRAPALWPDLISIAEHRTEPTLPLEDLAVTADATRFRLVSLSAGRPVEPTMLNAVDLEHFTHPLARLLCELPRARTTAVGPFSWGAAKRLPFLPRIRHGGTILAPATWRIEARHLPEPGTCHTQWTDALASTRERLKIPGIVHLGEDDQRLRLDLNHGTDAAHLRSHLQRNGYATLREAPDAAACGWFGGRSHEITLALASTQAPAPPVPLGPAQRQATVDHDHGHLPGASPWAYVKLYGHPNRAPQVLTEHLPRLWEEFAVPPPWWFVRYRDPQDHLRLRVRLHHPEEFGNVAARVGSWATDLRRRGVLGQVQWDTYYPETGRYGTGAAMAAAETVFAADSAAVLAQLGLTANCYAHPQAVAAASLLDLAVSFTGDLATGMHWLIDHVTTEAATYPTRALHREAMRLATPDDGRTVLRSLPGGDRVAAAWHARREALARYHAHLIAEGANPPENVLPSLMHMHHLRAAGIDQAAEYTCYRLARSCALAWVTRSKGAVT